MSAKPGSSSVALKLGVVLAIVIAVAAAAFFGFRDTAKVVLVTRGTATDAVPGSVVVYADGLTKELKTEVEGKVAVCDALETARHFNKGDILLQLDTTELDRQIAQDQNNHEAEQQRQAIVLSNIDGWKEARKKLDAAVRDKAPAEEVARLQSELNHLVRVNTPEWIDADKNLKDVVRRHDRDDASEMELKAAQDRLKRADLAITLSEFDAARAKLAYELALRNNDLQLKRRTVYAPSDGVVQECRVWVGELIGGGTVVATFLSDDRIVVAKIGEEDFSKVKVGAPATVNFLIYPEKKFDATVTKVLPNAEPETQRYTVYLKVEIDPKLLVPNSNGQAVITVGEHKDALLIPRRAVFDINGTDAETDASVCVVKEGRVELRTVTLGFVSLTTVEVKRGLALDEQVIVENPKDFRNGRFVRAELLK